MPSTRLCVCDGRQRDPSFACHLTLARILSTCAPNTKSPSGTPYSKMSVSEASVRVCFVRTAMGVSRGENTGSKQKHFCICLETCLPARFRQSRLSEAGLFPASAL